MGSYKGQITLINVNDGPPGLGVGINRTEISYAVSSSGTTPPEDGWQADIPLLGLGSYLWTKTVLYFTDGTEQISYQVSYLAIDGDGSATSSVNYKILLNLNEILKFYDNENDLYISPELLSIKIFKSNASSEQGEILIENLLQNNFTISICNPYTGEWILIDNSIITIDGVNNSIAVINLSKLVNNQDELFENVSNIFTIEETVLSILYLHIDSSNNKYKIVEYISERFGMNKDMALLSLNANGIVASIQNTKISFNANGLIIMNGGITIKNNNQENVLYADNDGNLIIKGTILAENGYFRGDITGATGTFSGRLEATDGFFSGDLQGATGSFLGDISGARGILGGFIIGETELTSKKVSENGTPLIILNGENGTIEALNITLGTGAKIKEYIKIGDKVFLKNALTDTSSFISITNGIDEIMSLKANGTMIVGNKTNIITIDGNEGSIYSSNFINGLGWKISGSESIFNDVVVKGSIKASVIEYGSSLSIGGTLLVRPSSRIKSIELMESKTKVILEDATGFNINDWCLIDYNNNRNYYKIIDIQLNEIYFNEVLSTAIESYPIINFGKNKSVGISINGSIDSTLSTPLAISVFEFDESIMLLIPKIILGKLPEEEQYGFASGTYGLYAENVLLKGSLVTLTNTEDANITYSGISTLYSGDDAPRSDKYEEWFGENTGEILLWAGAKGTAKELVEDSKFFVDKNGNLFAGSGYFKGTIITDAKITASEIETAILTGAGNNPALKIKDAKFGIVFSALVENQEVEIFKLTDYEIKANINLINFNNNFKIINDGSTIAPRLVLANLQSLTYNENLGINGLIFTNNSINYTNNFKFNEMNGTPNSFINFYDGLILSPDGVNETITTSTSYTNINNLLNISLNVKYGDIIEYKPVYEELEIIGYDLYIE